MSQSKMAMPLIVLNMGAEMAYILNQRLQAQNVNETKAQKVLIDITRAMFSETFMSELFSPQEMYTNFSTKQIFEKMTHSSIMRLNQSSMDKLFDLMTMGFKHQLLSCTRPIQLLQVTLTHLDFMKSICQSTITAHLVQSCIQRVIDTYTYFSDAQWMAIKIDLLRYLQGKKIKVSLFLQQEMQTTQGDLVFPPNLLLPYGTDIPGKVTYYESDSVIRQEEIPLPWPDYPKDIVICHKLLDVNATIGKNLYTKEAINDRSSGGTGDSILHCMNALEQNSPYLTSGKLHIVSDSPSTKGFSRPRAYDVKSSAKAEINLLSDLLGFKSGGKDEMDIKPLRLNLFPTSNFDTKDGEEDSYGEGSTIMIDIDGRKDAKTVQKYMEDLDFNDEKAESKGGEEEDDLLALMDSASSK